MVTGIDPQGRRHRLRRTAAVAVAVLLVAAVPATAHADGGRGIGTPGCKRASM
jgi:hypothetical protein